MRAVIIAPAYSDPSQRGKLHALAGSGSTVIAAVPERWLPTGAVAASTTARSEAGGVRIVPIPVSGKLSEPDDLEWQKKGLQRLLSETRPDVIQVEASPTTPVASLVTTVAGKLKLPVVLHTWDSLPRQLTFGERRRRRATMNALAGAIGGNELATALLAADRPGLPVATIRQFGTLPPVSTAHVSDDKWFRLGVAARLIPEKGLDVLFRAAARILGHWRLTLIGSGPSQEELERLAEKLGIAARITWLGALEPSAIGPVWPTLDCFVLCSRHTPTWVEVHASAVLDAMAHGVPVVGTRSGAIPELIGTAGVLIPEDDVEALAVVLQQLRDSPEGRSNLGAAGRQRVMQEFTDEALARKTLAFWGRLR